MATSIIAAHLPPPSKQIKKGSLVTLKTPSGSVLIVTGVSHPYFSATQLFGSNLGGHSGGFNLNEYRIWEGTLTLSE